MIYLLTCLPPGHFFLLMTPNVANRYSPYLIVPCYKLILIHYVAAWSSENGLSFNVSKCCLLRFQNKTSSLIPVTYHLNGVPIASREDCKDLGITFSSNLSWSQHYAAITAKAYRQLGLIRRTFSSSA